MSNKKITVILLVLMVLLAGATWMVLTKPTSQTNTVLKQVPAPASMMESGESKNGTMNMDDMPCHQMANGQWMGKC